MIGLFLDGPRPNKEEIRHLRAYMIAYVKEIVLKGHGVQDDEIQALINYLTTVHEDENVSDVLVLMTQLMAEHPASMVPAFDRKQGTK